VVAFVCAFAYIDNCCVYIQYLRSVLWHCNALLL